MNANVTILSTRSVGRAGRVDGDGVKRTEVTAHTADFILKDFVVEASLEFSLSRRGRGDLHSGLATTENHVILLGGDGGGVERSVGRIRFQDGEIAR